MMLLEIQIVKEFSSGDPQYKNVTGNLSGTRKMTPYGNTDLHKGRKSTRNVNYIGKPIRVFLIV